MIRTPITHTLALLALLLPAVGNGETLPEAGAAPPQSAGQVSVTAPAMPEFHKWAPTPPMGWNSYDNFGDTVTEAEVLANADYQRKFLLPHGWQYVVVDYRWYDPDSHIPNTVAHANLALDEFGRPIPTISRFPSAANGRGFKPLADKVHAMGLKFGIHLMRGIPRLAVQANLPIEGSPFKAADAANVKSTCGWSPDMYGVHAASAEGQAWYDSVLRLCASWEVDFVKVDDLGRPYGAEDIEAVRKAIDKTGRRIVFSVSHLNNRYFPGSPEDQSRHVSANANMWRVSSDVWDNWGDLRRAFDLAAAWTGVARPGCWPDHDMLPLGHIGLRTCNGTARTTHFTRDEQLTLMSFWCMAPSPLMVGANLPQNDDWTLSLLTNDEAIAINQDTLGKSAARVSQNMGIEIWVKELAHGDRALGVFNLGGVSGSDLPATVRIQLGDLGIAGTCRVRDVWKKTDILPVAKAISIPVPPPHGCGLYRLKNLGGRADAPSGNANEKNRVMKGEPNNEHSI